MKLSQKKKKIRLFSEEHKACSQNPTKWESPGFERKS